MARPIKETPVLTGKDAVRLAHIIDNPRVVTHEEVEAAKKSYDAVMAIAKFSF